MDISDGLERAQLCLLGFLFLGSPEKLPCGIGSREAPSNRALLNWNGDGNTDLSDAVGLLGWLFLGGPTHVLGSERRTIIGCPDVCTRP